MDRKLLFIIAVATLITIITWVIADVLHARAAVEPSAEVQQVIQPLDPNFDSEAIKLVQ